MSAGTRPRVAALGALLSFAACASPASAPDRTAAEATSTAGPRATDAWAQPSAWRAAGDPSVDEVALPAESGWTASLVIDNGTVGIWTVEAFPVFPEHGTPDVVGLDDKGRCHILAGYSGKWTDLPTIHDVKWLGGLAHFDVDPRFPGRELYTGGERGNLYQVLAYAQGAVDHRLIAFVPGMEIHTIVAGDFDPRTPGAELLVFTRPGGLYRSTPTGRDGGWETTRIAELDGRVRDAIEMPPETGRPREVACVSRAGWLRLLRITQQGPEWETVYEAPMGLGRVALRPAASGGALVLYTTHDDGRVLRHERGADRAWRTEVVYHGPQGPRGVVAGRFDPDPSVETVAVFGYSGLVELLSRRPEGAWSVETIFRDRHKGHWLAAAELDGRNATDEILTSGYGARIVLLARPPGAGRVELVSGGTRESAGDAGR